MLKAKSRDGRAVPIELSVGEAMIGGQRRFIGVCRDIGERLPEVAKRSDFDPLILVAEDHPLNRRVIGILLEEAGLRHEYAEDGMEAVRAAASGRFDIILMDVHMPRLDGLEATRRIRAMEGTVASTPIIAVTANASVEEVSECLGAGMNGFVGKPINAGELFSALQNHMRLEGGANSTDVSQ